MAHKMMIEDTAGAPADWQGALSVICHKCSELPIQEFNRLARKSWKRRRVELQGHAAAVRSSSWKDITEHYVQKLPGESQKEHRRRVLSWICTMATLISNCFQKASPQDQCKLMRALDRWAAEKEAQAENPHWTPSLDGAEEEADPIVLLPDSALQYLSEISKGLDEYFACRKCGFFCPNVFWAKNTQHEQFACSQCGVQYRPWVQGEGLAPFQKLLVCAPQENFTTPTGHKLKAGECEVIPTIWEDTSTAKVKNAFKEVCARISSETKTWSRSRILDHLQVLVCKSCARSYFSPHSLSSTAQSHMDSINVAAGYIKWDYRVLVAGTGDGTFPGAFYHYKPGSPILSFEDMIRVWAYSRHIINGARARI
jgi:hypothetical protein